MSGELSSSRELAARIRSVADTHIENGARPEVVRLHVRMLTGVAIGEGAAVVAELHSFLAGSSTAARPRTASS